MLFHTNKNIYNFVYYNETTSIILIEYRLHARRVYFKVNPVFFNASILPLLRSGKDFRGLLHWATNNGHASELQNDNPLIKNTSDQFSRVTK